MTQGDVAMRIGVSEHVYWKYEKARMWPSVETL
jgi:DNA-binding XRE family transcriptional regulator